MPHLRQRRRRYRRHRYSRALRYGAAVPGGLATPLRYHRGGFYEWDGCAWPEADEAALRARLYSFLDLCQSKTSKGGLCPVKPNALMVGGVLDALRAAAHLDAAIAPPAWLDDVGRAAGGHDRRLRQRAAAPADVRGSCRTRRSFFTHNALDYRYDRGAPEPRNGSTSWASFGRTTRVDRDAARDLRLLPDPRHPPAKGVL